MNVKDFQNLCTQIVEAIDKKGGVKRTPHFSFTQLMEELGELARAVNMPRLRRKPLNQDNLNEEFADVLIQLAILAKMHNVDWESATKAKIEELKKRCKLENG